MDFNVNMSQESLPDYLRRVFKEKDISSYEVERRSGRAISQSYAARIRNGHILNPSTTKLKALAKGLGVPESELFAAARGVNSEGEEISHERLQSIDFEYQGMPKKKKQKADYVIELLEREIKRIIEEPE